MKEVVVVNEFSEELGPDLPKWVSEFIGQYIDTLDEVTINERYMCKDSDKRTAVFSVEEGGRDDVLFVNIHILDYSFEVTEKGEAFAVVGVDANPKPIYEAFFGIEEK